MHRIYLALDNNESLALLAKIRTAKPLHDVHAQIVNYISGHIIRCFESRRNIDPEHGQLEHWNLKRGEEKKRRSLLDERIQEMIYDIVSLTFTILCKALQRKILPNFS